MVPRSTPIVVLPIVLLATLLVAGPARAQDADEGLPSIEEKTEEMDRRDGFFPVYWDTAEGKVWLELPQMNEEFLYVNSLPVGLGSNDIGLDRGQLGGERVVYFERIGPKVHLVQPNLDYRASTDNPMEEQAVTDAFAKGVLWGFEVAAETGDRVLVDATDFIVRDAHGIARRLKQTDQGSFSLDASRSAPFPTNVKAFPQNTEMEARVTFIGDAPGRYVRDVAAHPESFTLRVRHSFVQLPDTDGYAPRRMDSRSGYFGLMYRDYAVPIGTDITQRFINRHRLTCAESAGADGLCPVEEPIVYYLDPGTPEPVRGALLDGARWWAEAFEAAGFEDAYRVEMLPDDADPMDVRYNTIQWVHRSTRGWSYGSSVTDPRTGEIIKGHVTLGSLRVRQDYLLAEGLLAPYDGANAEGFAPENDPMLAMALARIRQLSAHEVGHTLGLSHNFAASVNDRASVMDYPAPLATVQDGQVSLENAYDTDIGEWDKVTIRYGYAEPSDGQTEQELLDSIIQDYQDEGLHYITDADARPAGAAHPLSNLWDNGADPVTALEREMDVRAVALDQFDASVIRTGEPMALLEEALVPLYLRHRYQVEGTVKSLAGVRYSYAMRGDADATRPKPVGTDQQIDALDALLETLTPQALRLPSEVRQQIAPRPPGYPENRELFASHTGLLFDPYAPAEVAATMVLDLIIHPERAARLAYQSDFDANLPTLDIVLDQVTAAVWEAPVSGNAYDAELQRTVQQVWTDALLEQAGNDDVAPAVQARITQHLRTLHQWLQNNMGRTSETQAHRAQAHDMISRFLDRSQETAPLPADITIPPGSPIGSAAPSYVQRQERRRAALEAWAPARPMCMH